MKDFMPFAEHRFCTRHLYSNFRKKFPSAVLRKTFWMAATATHPVQHQRAMNAIAKHSRPAYDQLRKLEAKVWTKAHFTTTAKADNVENNMSECFNAWIITERYHLFLQFWFFFSKTKFLRICYAGICQF